MRHRVVLQRPQTAQDATGAVVPAWEDQAEVWASIEPRNGREIFKSDKYTNEVTTLITIRYYRPLDASWRVRLPDGSQVWGITEVIRPYNLKREMQIMCSELPMGEPIT